MLPAVSQVQGTCGFSSTVCRKWSSLSRKAASPSTRAVVSAVTQSRPAIAPASSRTGE
ncbi:hypothetical protein BHAOGJBA_0001 [Methylobacterium hispanicum]|uniref:Uncharacterized protein n=1 Tax=Methylobacterium hispanicum TaxID=270350 RepID=A0AAV4ZF10_9HYPH|nr:hypothetical protein BHAOGJBA_0001 [Methylobacterium hispanicum]